MRLHADGQCSAVRYTWLAGAVALLLLLGAQGALAALKVEIAPEGTGTAQPHLQFPQRKIMRYQARMSVGSPAGTLGGQWWKEARDEMAAHLGELFQQTHLKPVKGTVRLKLRVLPTGEVQSIQVLSAEAGPMFSTLCYRAVKATAIPPIPAEVLTENGGQSLEQVVDFAVLMVEKTSP